MVTVSQKAELLAPAGNFEKLQIAAHYGADAVYLGGKDFSLRNHAGNFSLTEMNEAVAWAHARHIKVYVTCNIYPRNFEIKAVTEYLEQIGKIRPDAIIIADPGIFTIAREVVPQLSVHLSTQANTTNYQTALFWKNLGVKRINAGRELSLNEISDLAARTGMEVEAFVHGAMCISYSGRCLLSSFMANRESNRGSCAHPCRWKYALVEAKRPGEYYPVEEDNHGTYFFNSRDLCMIAHLPAMIESGLTSLKIEGRMKGINYLAAVVKIYREAIDAYYHNPGDFQVDPLWSTQLAAVNNRGYCTGFYLGDLEQIVPNYDRSITVSDSIFVAKVLAETEPGYSEVEVRNKIFKGNRVEILKPEGPVVVDEIEDIIEESAGPVPFAQPGQRVILKMSKSHQKYDLLRRPVHPSKTPQ